MRVLHVSNYLPHSHRIWGGAEVACRSLVDLLRAEPGMDCAVAATPAQFEVGGGLRFFPVETICERHHAPYFFHLRHYWLSKDSEVERQMEDVIELYRPDLVHFHNFCALTFSALDAVKRAGLPAVLSVYDYWIFCPTNMLLGLDNRLCEKGHGFRCLRRCLRAQFSRRSHYLSNLPVFTRPSWFGRKLAGFDRVIALSRNSRDVIVRHGPPGLAVDVVPLPMDLPEEGGEGTGFERPTVMFAGWVQARKGPDMAVRAMAEVVKAVPQARLLVVGPLSESKYEACIRGLTAELGLDEAVTFTGKLPQERFDEAFRGAHVVVIAEQWENMSPVFALECMAARKAVVGGAIGGIPEFIRDGEDGLLVKHDDPGAYARAIVRLLADRELARRLGANAAARVRSLCDPRSVLERLLSVYRRAIRGADTRTPAALDLALEHPGRRAPEGGTFCEG